MTIRVRKSEWTLPAMMCFLIVLGVGVTPPAGAAAERTSFNVAWSIYVGWMPWDYADQSGILKKWADKYGIKIKLTQEEVKYLEEPYVPKKVQGHL